MNKNKSFSEYYAGESPAPFYILFTLFVFSNMLRVINFIEPVRIQVTTVRLVVNTVLLIICAMYAAFILLLWKTEPVTIAAAVGIIAAVGFGWNFIGLTNEFFCTITTVFLVLFAYLRDYKVLLKIGMICHIITMAAAALGLPFGYTELVYKVDTADVGFSMGLVYANHVGRMAFLILMIAWYLWGQDKLLLSIVAAWATAAVMWIVIECKTIALFLVVFPLCWGIIRILVKIDCGNAAWKVIKGAGKIVLLAMPFLCMLFTYIMGLHRTFFLEHWHFGQPIYALWMRFISAGILFKVYGFPLFGRDILNENGIMEIKDGHVYMATIVDNAYIYYLIAIGGIALIACMLWISFETYRAIKNKDYAFLLMNFFMCGYGILEVVLFQFEHNFLFFYPMTAAALAYKGLKKLSTEEDVGEDTDLKEEGNEAPLSDAGDDAPLPDAGNEHLLPDAGNEAPLPDAGDEPSLPDAGDDAPCPMQEMSEFLS